MNCPFCKKPLPKGNPRTCPNCKKELTNFYKMKETQEQMQADKGKTAKLQKIMVICFAVALVCILGVVAAHIISRSSKKTDAQPGSAPVDMAQVKAEINSLQVSDFETSEAETDYVLLTVKDFGQIVVRLRPDVAPISAQNFKELVARHYYDGTTFHRIMPGFMIQGGAGAEELTPIKGEFSSNGVENNLLHIRGVLSMARTTVKDSATSQFFLMQADNDTLDGNYAAFGYIVAGLETVDKVCQIELGYNAYNGEKSVPQEEVLIESAVFATPKK